MVDTPLDPSRRAVVALFPYAAPVLRHGGWFGFFLILAPVVGPRGYGLFIIALSGIAIAEALLGETATQALINLAVVQERHWSTALVTMIVAGGAVSLLVYALTGVAGMLVGEPGFGDIFKSLALLPLLGALSVVPRASLHREGQDMTLLAASATGLLGGGGAAISLAWAGAGPWSLVAQIVVQRLIECVVLWGTPGQSIGLAWSRRHFAEIAGALDGRALAAALPAVSRFAPCLLVGLLLGPTATGLYLLAACLPEALGDIFLAGQPGRSPSEIPQHACRVALPAVLAGTLLAIALPSLIDLRWWGAVLPAQILLFGAIPAAIVYARAALAESGRNEFRWRAAETLGGVALVAIAAPYGLVTIAAASVGWLTFIALASLWPLAPAFGFDWRSGLAAIARPCIGATLAGILLFVLAGPVGSALDAVPALCLLTASGWLVYLIVRGEPGGAEPALARPDIGVTRAV